MLDVIQAFLLAWKSTGRRLAFLKHLGFLSLPNDQERQTLCSRHVGGKWHSNPFLASFPAMQGSPLKVIVFYGSALKNSAVSLALNTFRASYLARCSGSRTFHHSSTMPSSMAAFSPHTLLKARLWRLLKRASQPAEALNSSMFIFAANLSGWAQIRGPLTGRLAIHVHF